MAPLHIRGTRLASALSLLLPLAAGCSSAPSSSPGVTSSIPADRAHTRPLAPRPAPDPAGPESPLHPSLSTDVALRIQDAQGRFGPSTRVQVEGPFVLVDPQHASMFLAAASMVHRTVASLAAGPFPEPLEKAVTVTVFGSRACSAR